MRIETLILRVGGEGGVAGIVRETASVLHISRQVHVSLFSPRNIPTIANNPVVHRFVAAVDDKIVRIIADDSDPVIQRPRIRRAAALRFIRNVHSAGVHLPILIRVDAD